ncbi:MAG: hypothetical protein HZB95_02990 [Nitrosomonadales bacterium]|nr:hypothetical protein [Nitrosomonadales bacterium]
MRGDTQSQRTDTIAQITPEAVDANDRETLLKAARKGEVVVLDVRPAEEYLNAHLPFARSIPLEELRQRLAELPRDRSIVAYCRGPYCLMAVDAVTLCDVVHYLSVSEYFAAHTGEPWMSSDANINLIVKSNIPHRLCVDHKKK